MLKKKMVYVLLLCLTLGGCVVPVKKVSAASFSVNAFTKDGRVTNITSKKLVLRRQTGSSPESWGKPQKYKVTAATKFYRCKGYNSSHTRYKAKKVSKKKALKSIYNNGSNYVVVKTKGKKVVCVLYNMENYVG